MELYEKYLPIADYRLKVVHKFYDLIREVDMEEPEKFVINLEKSIHNYAVSRVLVNHSTGTEKLKFQILKHYYISKANKLYLNIKKDSYVNNPDFDISGLSPLELVRKTDFEIFPNRYSEYFEQKALEENRTKFEEVDFESLIQCRKCKQHKVIYHEILYSGDESSIKRCFCKNSNCGHTFTFK
jgi:DNA-directed RNA polymerase subunit M/transcription elongation factor TFIIS